jgi:hypothetical protein
MKLGKFHLHQGSDLRPLRLLGQANVGFIIKSFEMTLIYKWWG